jgi:hypothetical protein
VAQFFQGPAEIAALFKWGVPGFFRFQKNTRKSGAWGIKKRRATFSLNKNFSFGVTR